jgi:hypothetical protein
VAKRFSVSDHRVWQASYLAPGMKDLVCADIIIVNGDPAKDIRLQMDAAKSSDFIIKDGLIYKNHLHYVTGSDILNVENDKTRKMRLR